MDVVAHVRDWPWPISAGEPVVVGVSGGVDSMVLAEVLRRIGFVPMVVAHLNHGLRAGESDADEGLVREWAMRHGCECEVGREDVAARAAETGDSLETAGRKARRAFFQAVAERRGLRRVVLAHHADDQVETLVMHLLRGAGTHGLAGMRAVTPWGELEILRPLLGVWRRDLEAWARSEQIVWREDATNQSPDHFRNRVRHIVLPALEAAAGRDVREALRHAALLAADDDAQLAFIAAEVRAGLETADPQALPVSGLRSLSPSLARRVVREWLRDQAVPEVGFEVVEAVLTVARSTGRPASCNVAGGRRVRRRAGLLFLDTQGLGREPA